MKTLLTGASGQLGAYLIDRLRIEGHRTLAWSGSAPGERAGVPFRPVDLTDERAIFRALDEDDPETIIHAAAISAADAVRIDPIGSRAVNVAATRSIAEWAGARGRRMVFTSTDLVFDGCRAWNKESDPAFPILEYGRTKREAEPAVMQVEGGVVARLCLLYGPSRCGRPYFFTKAIEAIRRGEPRTFFEDEHRTPLDFGSAALCLVALAKSDFSGLFHVAGPERMSRYELMRRAATVLGLDSSLVRSNRRIDASLAEPRPADVSLDTTRLSAAFPDLERLSVEEALLAR